MKNKIDENIEKALEFREVIKRFHDLRLLFSRYLTPDDFISDELFDYCPRLLSKAEKEKLMVYKGVLKYLVEDIKRFIDSEIANSDIAIRTIRTEIAKINSELLKRLTQESGLSIAELKSEIKSLE